MKVLMVTDNYCLEEVDGVYYHRCIDEHIAAYRSLGEIRLLMPVLHDISYNRVVDLSSVGVRAIDKENTISKRFINRKNNKAIFDEEIKNADIVIGFVPSSVCDLALKYAKKYHKIFISVVISSAWDILWHHSLAGKILAPISHVSTSRTIRNSDYVIYVTDQYLQRKYPTNGVSVGISDVVVPETSHTILDKRKERIEECLNTKKVRIATIGAVDVKYKAQDDVIKAMSILASEGYDIDYTLIGGGSTARLRKCAEENGVSLDKIRFMGAVPHEQIYGLLDEFDLYIQPSRTEGMPRSVVEAMSRGLIVICSNVGGMPEIVDNKCVYRSGNITELTESIRFMLASKQRMIDTSIRNFNKAKCFGRDFLDRKRSEFLTQVKKDFIK